MLSSWKLGHWRSEAEVEIAEHEKRVEYLRNLFWTHNGKGIPIFHSTRQMTGVHGSKVIPATSGMWIRALWSQEFPAEMVEKQLFKDKNLYSGVRAVRPFFWGWRRRVSSF